MAQKPLKGLRILDSQDEYVIAPQDAFKSADILLRSTNWQSDNTIIISINGIHPTSMVLVCPNPTDLDNVYLYNSAGVICTTQLEGSLTFHCNFTPLKDLKVNVLFQS